MTRKKSDQIKTYVLLGLSLVLVVALFFRFTGKRAPEATMQEAPKEAVAELDIPEVDFDSLGTTGLLDQRVREALREPVRDLFLPGAVLGRLGTREDASRKTLSVASLKLKGVVKGGGRPVALINDEFVRTGDTVDGYRIVRIEPKEVLVDSGTQIYRLEMKAHD